MFKRFSIATVLLSLILAACGDDGATVITTPEETTTMPADDGHGHIVGTYVQNAEDFAGKTAADWDNAETVRVELSEYAFTPTDLTFEAGMPYKLELVNVGQIKHEVAAVDFFGSVAWRKVESPQSEVKAPFFNEIEVFPGATVELFFVPITPGTYEVLCELEGHLEAGMRGTVTVVGTAPTSPVPVFAAIDEGSWVIDGAELVAAADWETMETIEIELSEFAFSPNEIHLTVGQPYKLVFTNIGGVKHEATAAEFFQTIALRKVEDASGEFKAPTLLEVETFAGAVTEVFLIPQTAGTYDLLCEIEGHFEAGMFGTIVVEDA